MAKDCGFDGVEIRGIGNDVDAYESKIFSAEEIEATKQKLKSLHLEIPCLSSNCCLKDVELSRQNKAEIKAYIDLAQSLGTEFVRVLADRAAYPEGEVDDKWVASELSELAAYAHKASVILLVETNGVYSDTKRLMDLVSSVGSDNVAVLWDLHHPYRIAGESAQDTVQNLGSLVKHVHIKDSLIVDGKPVYKLMGEGDLPVAEFLGALRSIDYDGYISLEWLKRWIAGIEDSAIVIPHFSNYMLEYLGPSHGASRSSLQQNKSGTGYFIWEKETLVDLTFPQLLDRVAEEFPDQPAFVFDPAGYSQTYSEFRDEVDTFARSLVSMGVRRGDKVAIWATNVPEWFTTFWAATKIGAVLVTVNTAYKIHEAEYLLRQSDTHTLVMIDGFKDSDYNAIIQEICPELAERRTGQALRSKRLPFLRNVVSAGSGLPGAMSWEEALSMAGNTPIEIVYQRAASLSRHDVCNMQYTSGTTGFPKGVMLTHYNVINNGKNIGDRMDLSTADRFLIQVPMFHCFGMVLTMTASMTHGSTMYPVEAFSPRLGLELIHKHKLTAVNGVPTMFIAMLGHELFESTDFSSMRTGIMAGSPCPAKVMSDVVNKMNMADITIVFGQTESSPGCTMSSADDSMDIKVNTVGGPLPEIECKIVDAATGRDVPDNTIGEFVARGYNIMKGYYKMPVATAEAIDQDGWLHTGDLALRMPDGNFKITGRIRDMIIRGGENIYPKEIEDFLYTHPKVKDVQVVGVPDKQYGEEIMALVILNEGESATQEEIADYVRASMARHKTPRYVRFVDSFLMNAAGKILKYKLVEEAIEYLGLDKETTAIV